MIIHEFKGMTPEIGDDCFIAETAVLVGDVKIGDNCSLWYGAVLRGDVNAIEIGNRVNVQDCAVIHVSGGKGGDVKIGDDVIIGHNATVHAATVGSHCLIGMGSTVLDGAVIGNGSLIAAGALVLGNTVIGDNEMWAGVPAKFVKKISPAAVERTIDKGVQSYVELIDIYNKEYLA